MDRSEIDIVIVDDSPVYRKFLSHVLRESGSIRIAGTAADGDEAIRLIPELKPAVVLMDINMPGMDGFEATAKIMSIYPIPVIIISSEYTVSESAKTFRAFEAGAVAILPKPPGPGSGDHKKKMAELVTQIRLMSEIKVVRRTFPYAKAETIPEHPAPPASGHLPGKQSDPPLVVGIGASAGGPIVIREMLFHLNKSFKIPIIIVQHIDPSFAEGFAEWLRWSTSKEILTACDGMELREGKIYLPPPDSHIGFHRRGVIAVDKSPPDKGLRPSVHYLFTSMAATYGGDSTGILLTGMGTDGAQALRVLRNLHAVTIAQDAGSSMIHGMPGEAIKLGAAAYILTVPQMIRYLNDINTEAK